MTSTSARCAVHPARPALDECPVCGRPRCAADARAVAAGCAACQGRARRPAVRPLDLAAVVGGAIACNLAVLPLAAVVSQYVGAGWWGYVVPFLHGLMLGVAVEAGARRAHGLPLRLVAVGYAVIGTAYAVLLVPGRPSPLEPFAERWPAYVAAALGAWLWTAPPRIVRKAPEQAAE